MRPRSGESLVIKSSWELFTSIIFLSVFYIIITNNNIHAHTHKYPSNFKCVGLATFPELRTNMPTGSTACIHSHITGCLS